MEVMELSQNNQCNYWMEIFANFRKGTILNEIIKAEEPFVKNPYWISPVYADGCRLYHTFEIDGIVNGENFPLKGEGPLWDGVCKDESSRKYLFIRVVDSPEDLKGSCPEDFSEEEREGMKQAFRMLNLSSDVDIDVWFNEYFPVAKELTYAALLSDPFGRYLDRGYRCELILLSLIGNYRNVETSKAEWDAFYKEMVSKMFGDRGMPFFVFSVDFEV